MNHSPDIQGIHQGVYYGQNERVDELNDRINTRFYPDFPMQPNYNPRPVSTKYALFPIIDRVKSVKEKELNYPQYNTEQNFYPGTTNAPPQGIFNLIDTEILLRNQTMALQHGAEQAVYIPSSQSDLYNISIVSKPSEQPYPLLFSQLSLDQNPHPNNQSSDIGKHTFFNHTRTQLRNGM